jgi:hypothetical protein
MSATTEDPGSKVIAQQFQDNAYVVLPKVVGRNLCYFLCDYFFLLRANGLTSQEDPQVPGADVIYGADAFETLLARLTQPLSRALGVDLYPTYSFARIYKPGDVLKPHRDRKSCEISATLHLGGKYDALWPIFIRDRKGQDVEVALEVGDALVYRGPELFHWRNAFEGEWWAQIFLHYVDKNGEYRDQRFDTRPNLGYPLSSRRAAG